MQSEGKKKDLIATWDRGTIVFDFFMAIFLFGVCFYLIYQGIIENSFFWKIVFSLTGLIFFFIGLNKITIHFFKKINKYVLILRFFFLISTCVTMFIWLMTLGILYNAWNFINLLLIIIAFIGIIFCEYSLIKTRQIWDKLL